ncbi:hypothetical protein [Marinobacterium jannaschii]|uniref:hypothetical protein n=1 Tax=Marinobacterium jannaschii TaxID=64970 RepID=UPI0014726186
MSQGTGSRRSTTNSPEDEQKRIKVDQFYSKLRAVYGKAKYDSQFADAEDLKRSKRNWANEINKLTATQYNLGFKELKKLLQNGDPDYQWPDIGKVIGLCTRAERLKAAHKIFTPLPKPEKTDEQRQRGNEHLEALKRGLI